MTCTAAAALDELPPPPPPELGVSYLPRLNRPYSELYDSNASIIASSDQGVGFDRDSSMPSRLQRPYSVPVGMPNSVLAFCTEVCPARIASKARSKSSADQVVGAALNGAARRMPSRRAILYSVDDGMPNAFEALLAEIVPVRSASSALLSESSFHVLDGPSFFGVSMPSRCARCHSVVDGIPQQTPYLPLIWLWFMMPEISGVTTMPCIEDWSCSTSIV
uniref:Uncharacterized protein n=1 Tax=Anopheles coluzzii TaxID=1518534 RepID=A0A8W7PV29_ANOCL